MCNGNLITAGDATFNHHIKLENRKIVAKITSEQTKTRCNYLCHVQKLNSMTAQINQCFCLIRSTLEGSSWEKINKTFPVGTPLLLFTNFFKYPSVFFCSSTNHITLSILKPGCCARRFTRSASILVVWAW